MSQTVVVSRRGLLARVFFGAWLLALVASAIARTAIGPVSDGAEHQTPLRLERPEAVQGMPNGSPRVENDRQSQSL